MIPSVSQYAGQQLLTGQQAEAYADHFIAVHIDNMSGGKTYSQLSAEAIAQPGNTQLAGLVSTVFKGESLRSMLLNAYGWWKVSQIATSPEYQGPPHLVFRAQLLLILVRPGGRGGR